jgi:hypothetical protein
MKRLTEKKLLAASPKQKCRYMKAIICKQMKYTGVTDKEGLYEKNG